MEQLLTPQQVADILQLSPQAVTALLRTGDLRGRKVRGKWRVTQEALDDYLRKDDK